MESKTCTKCKKTKDANLINFAIESRVASGLSSWCRDCVNERSREQWRRKAAIKKSKKVKEELVVDEKVKYTHVTHKEVPVVITPKINVFKGRDYSIQVPWSGKGTEGRVVRGKVIQETDKLVVLQLKNYIESFSKWELSKYKMMEV